jgi:hypothetical protein
MGKIFRIGASLEMDHAIAFLLCSTRSTVCERRQYLPSAEQTSSLSHGEVSSPRLCFLSFKDTRSIVGGIAVLMIDLTNLRFVTSFRLERKQFVPHRWVMIENSF